jgi:L-ascorbate metabolism protein UlaG (beta-lactamase superfamily)
LDHVLSQEQAEQLNDIDILLVPVGGRSNLTSGKAVDVVGLLEPKIIIPMHYKIPGLAIQLDGANRFLKELGVEAGDKLDTLTVTKGQLPEESRVILLEPKQ